MLNTEFQVSEPSGSEGYLIYCSQKVGDVKLCDIHEKL